MDRDHGGRKGGCILSSARSHKMVLTVGGKPDLFLLIMMSTALHIPGVLPTESATQKCLGSSSCPSRHVHSILKILWWS